MAKVKNMSGQVVEVPALGRVVLAGQVVEVTDEQVYGLTCSANWEAADKAAKDAHAAGEKLRDERVEAEHGARYGATEVSAIEPAPESGDDADDTEGN